MLLLCTEDAEYAIEGVAYINGTDINGTVRFVRNDGALSVEVKLRGLTGLCVYNGRYILWS